MMMRNIQREKYYLHKNVFQYFLNEAVTYQCAGGRLLDTDQNASSLDIECGVGNGGLRWTYPNGTEVDFTAMPSCVHSELITLHIRPV